MVNLVLRCVKERTQNLSRILAPFKVVLVDTSWEEGNVFEKCSGVGAEVLEHGGDERKFDCGSEALVVYYLQHTRPPLFPFSGQSTRVPLF